jgi:hypothetical protein
LAPPSNRVGPHRTGSDPSGCRAEGPVGLRTLARRRERVHRGGVPAHDRAVDDAERLVLDAIRGMVAALHPYAPPPVQLDSAISASTARRWQSCWCGSRRRWASACPPACSARPARSPQEPTTLAASLDWHATTHPDRFHVRILGENADTKDLTCRDCATTPGPWPPAWSTWACPGESVASPSPCAALAGSSAAGDASCGEVRSTSSSARRSRGPAPTGTPPSGSAMRPAPPSFRHRGEPDLA